VSGKKVREMSGIEPGELRAAVTRSPDPLVFRGLVADWPVVKAANHSYASADRYIRSFYRNATVGAFFGNADAGDRVFYNADMSGFNYQPAKVKLDTVLDRIQQCLGDERAPFVYVGSTTVDTCLPGFRAENDLDFGVSDALASIWIGNRTRVAAHHDVPDNMACCAVGRRRFTLFPPGELKNLYPGPLDFTPAGQTISMVDFSAPDFDRHPRFRDALKHALVAELRPGDVIFIPSMWWHHVEAVDGFNVLINYWWRESPAFAGTPVNVLEHALLSLRDLPPRQRKAWHELFKYYIFDFDPETVTHIPAHRRGVLSPIDETAARKLRARLLNKLNR